MKRYVYNSIMDCWNSGRAFSLFCNNVGDPDFYDFFADKSMTRDYNYFFADKSMTRGYNVIYRSSNWSIGKFRSSHWSKGI